MKNATLFIATESDIVHLPVTWANDTFVEGEELYERIFQSEEIIDWESDHTPDFDVVLDADQSIRCRVSFDDMAGVVYPNRNLSKLVSK